MAPDTFAAHACAAETGTLPWQAPPVVVRTLGRAEYRPAWQAMQAYTAARSAASADELWVLEHPSVYTLGQAGKAEHLLATNDIPLVNCDRGGQITYHGPGQAVVYTLVDLRRRGYGIRELVNRIEQAVIDLLADFDLRGERRSGAPGVYVCGAKIAALGLRVRRGCAYHGVALNVDGDLAPFAAINPCGYPGLAVTRLLDHGIALPVFEAGERLAARLERGLR